MTKYKCKMQKLKCQINDKDQMSNELRNTNGKWKMKPQRAQSKKGKPKRQGQRTRRD